MTKKKKLIAIGLCLVILAATILNGTAAYFTDTQEATNTFTSGNVKITLDEGKVTLVDNRVTSVDVNDRISGGQSYGTLYPNQSFTKDPIITNRSTEAAYIAAKVVISDGVVPSAVGANDDITNLSTVIPMTGKTGYIDIKAILSGEILATANVYTDKSDVVDALETEEYVIYEEVVDGDYVFYFFVKNAVGVGNEVKLFNKVSINPVWDNAQMLHFQDFKIKVTGFGVQTFGFESSLEAVQAAFADKGFTGFVPAVAP